MNEVLNIISDSYRKKEVDGPYKVVHNAIKGLDLIGYPYVINKKIENYKYNWIHDSQKALIEVALKKIPAVVGPNLFVLPGDLPGLIPSLKHCVYLHPSRWCIDLWKELGYDDAPLFSWPVGIDTEHFKTGRIRVKPKQVMVYFKKRDPTVLEQVEKKLIGNGFEPKVIVYGNYTENEFLDTLATSLFGVWITISESQGIALQEALATGCPLLVLDVKTLFEVIEGVNYIFPDRLKNFKPTSVPYFDKRCGIIIDDLSFLDEKIKEMASSINNFEPRSFIMDRLSLEDMAQMLLGFFNLLDLSKHQTKSDIVDAPFNTSIKGNLIYKSIVIRRKIRTILNNQWIKKFDSWRLLI